MNYFSTFSGIGGFERGIEQAYEHYLLQSKSIRNGDEPDNKIRSEYGSSINGERRQYRPVCDGYAEIDRFAAAVYRYHYPEHKNFGNVFDIAAESIPDFDLFVGGFPCQTFSIAGKRAGFDDVRGTLFFEIARILKHKRPAHFLLENVKGLVGHDGGKTYQSILGILADIGYFVETIVLNSKDYGVPQNRERIFFIGHLADECEREILSFGNGYETIIPVSGTISTANQAPKCNFDGSTTLVMPQLKQIGHLATNAEAHRVYDGNGLARTIKNGGGMGAKTGLYQVPRGNNKGGDIKNDISPTVGSSSWEHNCLLKNETRIRRLTPVEAERLQGFPDDWTKYGINEKGKVCEMSDSARYKMCGNAVTTNVIQTVVSEMIKKECLSY